jgi:hypothetical protein
MMVAVMIVVRRGVTHVVMMVHRPHVVVMVVGRGERQGRREQHHCAEGENKLCHGVFPIAIELALVAKHSPAG